MAGFSLPVSKFGYFSKFLRRPSPSLHRFGPIACGQRRHLADDGNKDDHEKPGLNPTVKKIQQKRYGDPHPPGFYRVDLDLMDPRLVWERERQKLQERREREAKEREELKEESKEMTDSKDDSANDNSAIDDSAIEDSMLDEIVRQKVEKAIIEHNERLKKSKHGTHYEVKKENQPSDQEMVKVLRVDPQAPSKPNRNQPKAELNNLSDQQQSLIAPISAVSVQFPAEEQGGNTKKPFSVDRETMKQDSEESHSESLAESHEDHSQVSLDVVKKQIEMLKELQDSINEKIDNQETHETDKDENSESRKHKDYMTKYSEESEANKNESGYDRGHAHKNSSYQVYSGESFKILQPGVQENLESGEASGYEQKPFPDIQPDSQGNIFANDASTQNVLYAVDSHPQEKDEYNETEPTIGKFVGQRYSAEKVQEHFSKVKRLLKDFPKLASFNSVPSTLGFDSIEVRHFSDQKSSKAGSSHPEHPTDLFPSTPLAKIRNHGRKTPVVKDIANKGYQMWGSQSGKPPVDPGSDAATQSDKIEELLNPKSTNDMETEFYLLTQQIKDSSFRPENPKEMTAENDGVMKMEDSKKPPKRTRRSRERNKNTSKRPYRGLLNSQRSLKEQQMEVIEIRRRLKDKQQEELLARQDELKELQRQREKDEMELKAKEEKIKQQQRQREKELREAEQIEREKIKLEELSAQIEKEMQEVKKLIDEAKAKRETIKEAQVEQAKKQDQHVNFKETAETQQQQMEEKIKAKAKAEAEAKTAVKTEMKAQRQMEEEQENTKAKHQIMDEEHEQAEEKTLKQEGQEQEGEKETGEPRLSRVQREADEIVMTQIRKQQREAEERARERAKEMEQLKREQEKAEQLQKLIENEKEELQRLKKEQEKLEEQQQKIQSEARRMRQMEREQESSKEREQQQTDREPERAEDVYEKEKKAVTHHREIKLQEEEAEQRRDKEHKLKPQEKVFTEKYDDYDKPKPPQVDLRKLKEKIDINKHNMFDVPRSPHDPTMSYQSEIQSMLEEYRELKTDVFMPQLKTEAYKDKIQEMPKQSITYVGKIKKGEEPSPSSYQLNVKEFANADEKTPKIPNKISTTEFEKQEVKKLLQKLMQTASKDAGKQTQGTTTEKDNNQNLGQEDLSPYVVDQSVSEKQQEAILNAAIAAESARQARQEQEEAAEAETAAWERAEEIKQEARKALKVSKFSKKTLQLAQAAERARLHAEAAALLHAKAIARADEQKSMAMKTKRKAEQLLKQKLLADQRLKNMMKVQQSSAAAGGEDATKPFSKAAILEYIRSKTSKEPTAETTQHKSAIQFQKEEKTEQKEESDDTAYRRTYYAVMNYVKSKSDPFRATTSDVSTTPSKSKATASPSIESSSNQKHPTNYTKEKPSEKEDEYKTPVQEFFQHPLTWEKNGTYINLIIAMGLLGYCLSAGPKTTTFEDVDYKATPDSENDDVGMDY